VLRQCCCFLLLACIGLTARLTCNLYLETTAASDVRNNFAATSLKLQFERDQRGPHANTAREHHITGTSFTATFVFLAVVTGNRIPVNHKYRNGSKQGGARQRAATSTDKRCYAVPHEAHAAPPTRLAPQLAQKRGVDDGGRGDRPSLYTSGRVPPEACI